MSIVSDAMINFLEVCLVLIACGFVSRAVAWMPQHYASEEAAFIKEMLAQHAPQVVSPAHIAQVDYARPIKSFFSALPPANFQSGLTSIAVALAAAWAWYTGANLLEITTWFIFYCGLIILAVVDYKTKLLPDVLTLPLLWLGIVIQLFPETRTVGLDVSVLGAVAGYLPLWVVAQVYRAVRGRDGLGMGDLKLLAAMGAWSGPLLLPYVLLLAVLLALLVFLIERVIHRHASSFHEERPFGPAIVTAYFLVLIFA